MKIDDYYKLEKNISNYSFKDSYRNINYILLVLSILGHLTSIFLSNFLIVKVFSSIIQSAILVNVISVILLTGLELLKRDFFMKFSFQHLKSKSLSKEVIPLAIISFLIVSMSFYASIRGAKEFSSKSDQIEESKIETVDNFKDSLNFIYNSKIEEIEKEIKLQKSKIEDKDSEQTSIASIERPNSHQRNRMKDLKQEKSDIKIYLDDLEEKLQSTKTEKDSEISDYKIDISEKTDKEKNENTSNSLFFIIVSSIIELVILLGVYFNNFYKFKSYSDFKEKIESNSRFQKWVLYNKVIDILYGKDKSIGDKLPSSKSIIDVLKAHGIKMTQKEILDFLKIISSLGAIKTMGSYRVIQKNKDSSISDLRSYFDIE